MKGSSNSSSGPKASSIIELHTIINAHVISSMSSIWYVGKKDHKWTILFDQSLFKTAIILLLPVQLLTVSIELAFKSSVSLSSTWYPPNVIPALSQHQSLNYHMAFILPSGEQHHHLIFASSPQIPACHTNYYCLMFYRCILHCTFYFINALHDYPRSYVHSCL